MLILSQALILKYWITTNKAGMVVWMSQEFLKNARIFRARTGKSSG
jgi:hypothetical protein